MRHFFLCLLVVILSSCSFNSGLDSRISKLGAIALSDSNPYIASNLYFAERIRSSKVLAGFIKYRGMPSAIELITNYFKPNSLVLYYPKISQYYLIEGNDDNSIITGPFNIDPQKLMFINKISSQYQGQPALLEGGNVQVINNDLNTFTNNTEQVSNRINTNENDIDKIYRLQQNNDLPTGEVTSKGDLVHYVTFEGETLSLIARWYTHDAANVGRILRVNDIQDPNHLQLGDEVVIPKYLLKTKLCFGEAEFNELN